MVTNMATDITIFTIGHSTRSIEEFISILKAFSIKLLADVRTIPKSRYNPQFNSDVLTKELKNNGIHYAHMAGLGGLRHPRKDSLNTAWKNMSFRGFADYMQTEDFKKSCPEHGHIEVYVFSVVVRHLVVKYGDIPAVAHFLGFSVDAHEMKTVISEVLCRGINRDNLRQPGYPRGRPDLDIAQLILARGEGPVEQHRLSRELPVFYPVSRLDNLDGFLC